MSHWNFQWDLKSNLLPLLVQCVRDSRPPTTATWLQTAQHLNARLIEIGNFETELETLARPLGRPAAAAEAGDIPANDTLTIDTARACALASAGFWHAR